MKQEVNESYPVKRGKFDSLTIYEVTEQEIKIIENGSTNSIFFNFSIFLLSVCASFFVAIFTVEWFPKKEPPHLVSFIVFLVVAILTLITGTICFIVWLKSNDSFKETIKTIKLRLKEEKTEDPNDEESVGVKINE
jgi:hypothetical protein